MASNRPFGPGPFLRVQCANVFVRDLDRSLRFYVDQLGFAVAFDGRLVSGTRWIAVAPPDGLAMTLIAREPESDELQYVGRKRLLVFATDDVQAKFEEWHGRGVVFAQPPRAERWGGVSAEFEDPDGNSFSLVSHDQVSEAIEAQRRMAAETQEAERRIKQEFEIAKQVQARLFPQTSPTMRTLQYAGLCVQARQVGGDYYDFLDLGERRLGLVVSDISGKGIAAALLMAHLQANLRSQSATAVNGSQHFLRSVNKAFCENTSDSSYATLFFAEYNDVTRHLRYANCGHLPGLLLRKNGSLELLNSTGTVIGLFKQWDCSIVELALAPGDTLMLYTDGVTESFNDGGEEFGEGRLIAALRRHAQNSPQNVITAVINELEQFKSLEQHDDITLIVAQVNS
jgi:serine phosphatase RsbU (regulator of sigma subunit)/predicted enzyme related to lactoylglutathione lyase